ncbi:MAG: CoA pyrophosphatase [Rhizobiaceae bacterium]|nr:CoA pyrophosphatase [Rhizobiaceae bacterium]
MNIGELPSLKKSEFRRIVLQRLAAGHKDDGVEGDYVLNPDFQSEVVKRAIQPAAVLIPVIERANGLSVVFTRRTQKLKSHSGQVSFPGGKIDATDGNARLAALRETHEEVGVAPKAIDVLGQMPDYFTGSGYRISPVIGLLNRDVVFEANRDEVEYIFEVPLAFLMNPVNYRIGSKRFENAERYFYEILWEEQYIWGVTAGIVRMFYNRVFK